MTGSPRRIRRRAWALIAAVAVLAVTAAVIVRAEHAREVKERRQQASEHRRAAAEVRKLHRREADEHDRKAPAAVQTTPTTTVARSTSPATGSGALGVEIESMADEASTGAVVLGSLTVGEREYGCKAPDEGALITHVTEHGPAAAAGLQGATGEREGYPVGGDVIVGLDGSPTPGASTLQAQLAEHAAGEGVQVEVVHCDGEYANYTVRLAPASQTRRETLEEEAEQRAVRARQEAKRAAEERRSEAESAVQEETAHRETAEGEREAERLEQAEEACEREHPNRPRSEQAASEGCLKSTRHSPTG